MTATATTVKMTLSLRVEGMVARAPGPRYALEGARSRKSVSATRAVEVEGMESQTMYYC